MKPFRVAPALGVSLLIAIVAQAQQAGTKDLRLTSPEVAPAAQTSQDSQIPNGCKKMGVGYVDGFTTTEFPREIKLELVSISSESLIIGNEISATLKLQNGGHDTITIPWSTDFQTTGEGQDPNNRTWEFGQFQISLGNRKGRYVELIDRSRPLYGSKFLPGTLLAVKPGEWITVQIAFQVAEKNPKYESIFEGQSDLTVEWFQTVRTHVIKDCGLWLGFYPYDGFYEHKYRMTVGQVEVRHPENMQITSK